MPKLCERIEMVPMALPCQSCVDVSETVAMAFSVPKLCERIETVAKG